MIMWRCLSFIEEEEALQETKKGGVADLEIVKGDGAVEAERGAGMTL